MSSMVLTSCWEESWILFFQIGSVGSWMGDSKQLFLSFFCLCSLVLFTGTKGKQFCSMECQRIAVNGWSHMMPGECRPGSSQHFSCVSARARERFLDAEERYFHKPPASAHQPSSGFWSFKHPAPHPSCMDTPVPFKPPVPSLSSHWKRELLISFDIYEPWEPGGRCFSVLWACPGEQAANPFLTCCCAA